MISEIYKEAYEYKEPEEIKESSSTGWEKITGNSFSQLHFSKYRSATLSEHIVRTAKVQIYLKKHKVG